MIRATRIVLLDEKIKGIILLAYMFTNIFVYTFMTRATRIVFWGEENKRIHTHTLVVACHACATEIDINKVFGSMVAVFFKRKKQEKSYY